MTSSRVLSPFWTAIAAVLAVLTGIGALLGLRRVRPAVEPAVRTAAPAAALPVFSIPAARSNRARRRLRIGAGALPPTIKQRIGAEAHGSSPASRRTASGVSRRAEDFELTA
ncbi:DUF6344 domain-containing protein [Streptomyces sp. NPDC089919]|uniref:DUF6344 domain-containing protein n=1 Tax=Streptomyces sp. NPDC089919 TaxID=3155188 RepID=UPI003441F095